MEHFETIQGEGFHAGRAALFIRLGGCDVGCHWCDVKESWDQSAMPSFTARELAESAARSYADIVVVTGGEPAMHNLEALCDELKAIGKELHIETSGAYDLTGSWDWVTLSPKKFKAPKNTVLTLADELKAVVFNQSDFAFAESFRSELKTECKLYLQPEWSKRASMSQAIIQYVKQHPIWRISIQSHKYLNIP